MTTTPPRRAVSAAAGQCARPYLYGEEEIAVAEVLRGGYYAHGVVTTQFEREIAKFLGVPDAVAVSSGTVALQIALRAAGVGSGDEVIVPSLTFCATVQAIVACDARPRFIEVNANTLCVESAAVAQAITSRTRAVVPVLYGGRAIDLTSLDDILTDKGIDIVEDAAHAFGSFEGTVRVGASGKLTCFSFGPIKSLTCGQGGMVIPRDRREGRIARSLRNLGIVQSADQRAAATTYMVDGHGLRAQMSNLNAAVGRVQLAHFPQAMAQRKALWTSYELALRTIDDVAVVDVDVEHSTPSMCVVRLPEQFRKRVFGLLKEKGVGVGVHYPPNHLQPAFEALDHRSLPVTELVARQILTLPFHQRLTTSDVVQIAGLLEQALATAKAAR
ncbi:DegT/DnrJ/EryC1/StrS family aminotransferase [Streptomyces sp. NPDC058308]|uniref:DegT/DnrJ/EryC1/StrS family aminotransferase n=1 Tax=Streptomyces sp. NPDC058308 TaxID=3346440 RepID=UPI0036E916BA